MAVAPKFFVFWGRFLLGDGYQPLFLGEARHSTEPNIGGSPGLSGFDPQAFLSAKSFTAGLKLACCSESTPKCLLHNVHIYVYNVCIHADISLYIL